ncbi:MAG: manganese efflux pump MntP family protein [Oscillospiraceae bacterium]
MQLLELFLIAIGLSMDAFAVAICKGLAMERVEGKRAVTIALFFGGFQALMPLLGWTLGIQFSSYINAFDHWIAFVLLAIIGGKMVADSRGNETEAAVDTGKTDYRELLVLAIATSIDALAVGVTFAFLEVAILPAVGLIGVTTFILSLGGVFVGNWFGVKYKSRAELVGGCILLLIGLKILLEHLGILSF